LADDLPFFLRSSHGVSIPKGYAEAFQVYANSEATLCLHYAKTISSTLAGLFSKTPAKTIFYFYSVYLSLDMLMYYIDNLLRIGIQLRHHIGNNINIQMMNMVSRVLVSLL